VFRSRAPRAVVAALTAVVLIVGLMASATSAAPPDGKGKPTPTPTPTPSPTPTPTPTPVSDNRTVYFGDDQNYPDGNGDLDPSIVTAGKLLEFTLLVQNEGSQRLTHSEVGYGSQAVDQPDAGDSLPEGWTIESATLLSGAGSCTFDDFGALCDLGQFDAGETALIQIIVQVPDDPGQAFTYASFKVAENVPDQGANRNTFFANASFVIAPTNSNAIGTYKLGDEAFSLTTAGQTLVKKDSMTTTVSGPAREGATQTPFLEWKLIITGSISGVITHTLDNGQEVSFSGSCTGDSDGVDCIVSNTKNGNQSTIIFRTAANGKVRAN
jgi:hypothetical protein